MKTETKPSLLPWHILSEPNPRDLHPMVSIMSGEDRRESIVCNSCAPEDAKFICRAANNVEAMRHALEKARTFVEFARYELEPGKAVIGDQFPRQTDADEEIARINAALDAYWKEAA